MYDCMVWHQGWDGWEQWRCIKTDSPRGPQEITTTTGIDNSRHRKAIDSTDIFFCTYVAIAQIG